MRAKGWTRADLAREARCNKSDITQIFNGQRKQSPIVGDIEKALGMRRRRRARTDTERQISEVVEELDEQERRLVLERALAIRDLRKN